MLASPFTYYRGAAAVMASDLASTPVSGFVTQLCGDAHLTNFGAYASPERNLVFDINDFDETFPGPWEWDVKRLAASFVIAARDNGFGRKQRAAILLATVGGYRRAMAAFAGLGELAVWYARADADRVRRVNARQMTKATRRRFERAEARARTRDSMQALRKLTGVVGGQRQILADPPLVVPVHDLLPDVERKLVEEHLRGLLRGYRRSLPPDRRHLLDAFEFVDMARKVVGVGSVGTRCWIVLLRDWKQSAVVEDMDPDTMRSYGDLCGWVLARAHARTGDRVAIAAYLGEDETFDRALLEFAERYADQSERDHAALAAAAGAGRIPVVTGV
jgi:uncharacterized protein (DUF2252 family)